MSINPCELREGEGGVVVVLLRDGGTRACVALDVVFSTVEPLLCLLCEPLTGCHLCSVWGQVYLQVRGVGWKGQEEECCGNVV